MHRVARTLEQKKKVRDELERRNVEQGSFKQTDVADWAKNEFGLQAYSTQSTISSTLKHGQEGILE